MPSSLSYAMVAVGLGSAIAPRRLLRPFLLIGAASAVIPDVDAICRPFYGAAGDIEALGGHRGFTHSVVFAAVMGLVASSAILVNERWKGYRLRLGLLVAAATCLHGVLDLFTRVGAETSPVQSSMGGLSVARESVTQNETSRATAPPTVASNRFSVMSSRTIRPRVARVRVAPPAPSRVRAAREDQVREIRAGDDQHERDHQQQRRRHGTASGGHRREP